MQVQILEALGRRIHAVIRGHCGGLVLALLQPAAAGCRLLLSCTIPRRIPRLICRIRGHLQAFHSRTLAAAPELGLECAAFNARDVTCLLMVLVKYQRRADTAKNMTQYI